MKHPNQEDLLQCLKCNSRVEQAVQLRCNHQICLECASLSLNNTNTIICNFCSKKTQLDTNSLQVLQKISQQIQNNTNLCNNHQINCKNHSEPQSLFCFTCIQLLCVECYIQGNHKPHDVKNIKSSIGKLKEQTVQLQRQIFINSQQLNEDDKKISSKKHELDKIINSAKRSIQSEFEELFLRLEQKKYQLLLECDEIYQQNFHILDQIHSNILNHIGCLDKKSRILSNNIIDIPDISNQDILLKAFDQYVQNFEITKPLYDNIDDHLAYSFHLNTNSLKQFIDSIRTVKIDILSLRGLEQDHPSQFEINLIQKVNNHQKKFLQNITTQSQYQNHHSKPNFSSQNILLNDEF